MIPATRPIRIVICLVIAILFFSCKKSDLGYGSIEGSINIQMGTDLLGLSGIKVYLIDSKVKADTTTFKNENALNDTIITDQDGKFVFEKVAPGKYLIAPVSTDYKIENNSGLTNNTIEIVEGEVSKVSFSANRIFKSDYFNISITIKNLLSENLPTTPTAQYPYYKIKEASLTMYVKRRNWVFFIPYMGNETNDGLYIASTHTLNGNTYYDLKTNDYSILRAFTLLAFSVDNYFIFTATIFDSVTKDPYIFSIELPFTPPTSKANVEIDYLTGAKKITYN